MDGMHIIHMYGPSDLENEADDRISRSGVREG